MPHSHAIQEKAREMDDLKLFREMLIIRQNNKFRIRWDMIIIMFSMWNSFTAPLDYAYKNNMDFFKSDELFYVDTLLDIMFIFDMILNFRTSFIHP